MFDKVYAYLNREQRYAVYTINDPLLILAGAGSGKTTVLVNRIAFIIKYGNAYFSETVPGYITEEYVNRLEAALDFSKEDIEERVLPLFVSEPCPPYAMLAITFTNKAANEIKNRLASAISDENVAKSIWAGTFHSVCMRILRSYGQLRGYRENFSVYDTDDSKKTISSAMKALNIDEKALPIKTVMNEISRAKDNLITPLEYENEYAANDFRRKQIAKVYKQYQEEE